MRVHLETPNTGLGKKTFDLEAQPDVRGAEETSVSRYLVQGTNDSDSGTRERYEILARLADLQKDMQSLSAWQMVFNYLVTLNIICLFIKIFNAQVY